MTAREMAFAIGKTGVLTVQGLHLAVRVIDVRQVFSRLDYQVVPVAGSGDAWVSSDRVYLDEVA